MVSDRIKSVLELAAGLAAAGATIGAVVFGIGYLAVRQHDAVLGLATTTNTRSYLRAGGAFFAETVSAVASVITSSWQSLIVLVAVVVAAVAVSVFSMKIGGWLAPRLPARPTMVALALGTFIVVVAFYLPLHLAPLHSSNTGLLLKEFEPDSTSGWAPVRIYEMLHNAEPMELDREYGRISLLAMAIIYVFFLLIMSWRHSLQAEQAQHAAWWKPTGTWLLVPMAVAVVASILVTWPAVYGSLAMSYDTPCVSVITTDSLRNDEFAEKRGRLLTDLSSDVPDVVLYYWGESHFALELLQRSAITLVQAYPCDSPTILAAKVPQ
jgi:hypothetical protein